MATAKKAPAKSAAAKTAAPAKKRTPNAAFMKALTPSPALAAVVGASPLPRTEIISKLWGGEWVSFEGKHWQIEKAKLLLADLSGKNPNVFYELGLAHALEKPVVLVSSNQDDVPFDLRHIRVILYDQTDPFWGQKLIDKLADNLRSALADPEEAIFRVEEP